MIFINDEKPSEYREQERFLQEKLAAIKRRDHIPKGEKEYVFVDPKPVRLGNNGVPERKQTVLIPHKSSYMGVTWIYCRDSVIDKNGNRSYSPIDTMFQRQERLNPDHPEQAEKIFFYLFVSSVVKNRLKLQNLEKEIREKNLATNDQLTTQWLIKTTHSPISVESTKSDVTIRKIARAWYIPNVESVPIEQLKNKLLIRVGESEKNKSTTGRGYAEFVKEAFQLPLLELRSNIQLAIDQNIIEYYDLQWKYKNTSKIICGIDQNMYNTPNLALEQYFNQDIDALNDFKKAMSIYTYKENGMLNSGEIQEVKTIIPNPEPEKAHIPEELKGITKEDILTKEEGKQIMFYEKRSIARKLGKTISSKTKEQELNEILIDALNL